MSNRFVFVVPVYNASQTLARMLHSVCGQSYENWRVIMIDDMSDHGEALAQNKIIFCFNELLSHSGHDPSKISIVWNSDKRGKRWEMDNVLHGISMCEDDDIVCRLDADDWLVDNDALTIIDAAYHETGCDALWTAHRWGYSDRNISGPMPSDADPYRHPWVSSHLKTFRKRLINGIPYRNFLNHQGKLIKRAGDQGCYLPVLYRSKKHVYLPRCMYHYSIDEKGGLVYQTDDAKFQKEEADFIRARGYVEDGSPWEENMI